LERIEDPKKFQETCWDWRRQGLRLALVPTMGFFHEGHMSLMRWARENADKVAVSLFVNPTQFGPNEDLDSYPRNIERDALLAAGEGADVLFAPQSEAMYSKGAATWVEVPSLAKHLCGASRPTHFRGVCTVVAKLFMLAMPHVAVFGEKDWQQVAILRRMAEDLNFPIRIEGRPIVREADGLALSSRNVNLDPEERIQAPSLQKGLRFIADQVREGVRDTSVLRTALNEYYGAKAPRGEVDYLAFVDPKTLEHVGVITEETLAAVAVRFSRARLIDNLLLKV
jgi:pantoate--beta-alanine ligase